MNKNVLKWAWLPALTLLAGCPVSCPASSPLPASAKCVQMCQKSIALGCPAGEHSEAACEASCAQQQASCSAQAAQFDAYLDCILTTPMECGSITHSPSSPDCVAQGLAVLVCSLGGSTSSSSSSSTGSSSSSSGAGGGPADAGSDASDAGPLPQLTLATGLRRVTDIAVDDTLVYWAEDYESSLQLGAKIKAVPKGGGATVELADLGFYSPRDISVDDTRVYVAGAGACGPLVMSLPKAGGPPVALASDVPQCAGVAVGVDTSGIYFTTNADNLASVPLGGGAATTLATSLIGGYKLALDATHVYWSSSSAVGKVAKAGGASTTLATFGGDSRGIAVDPGFVYFTLTGAGAVVAVPLGGGTATQLAGGLGDPTDVAVDSVHAYFTDIKNGVVGRVPKGGGATVTIASAQDSPIAVALDAVAVYWGNMGNGVTGSIQRAGK